GGGFVCDVLLLEIGASGSRDPLVPAGRFKSRTERFMAGDKVIRGAPQCGRVEFPPQRHDRRLVVGRRKGITELAREPHFALGVGQREDLGGRRLRIWTAASWRRFVLR